MQDLEAANASVLAYAKAQQVDLAGAHGQIDALQAELACVSAQCCDLVAARELAEELKTELAAAKALAGALQGTITQMTSSADTVACVAASGRCALTEQIESANKMCNELRAALRDVAAKHTVELLDAASHAAALATEQRVATDAAVAQLGLQLHDARAALDAKVREFLAQAATADSQRSAVGELEVTLERAYADADKALADEVCLARLF